MTPHLREVLSALVASGSLPPKLAVAVPKRKGLWLREPYDPPDGSGGWIAPWFKDAPLGDEGWQRLCLRGLVTPRDSRWRFQAACGGEHGRCVCDHCGYRPEPEEVGSADDPVREFPPSMRMLVELAVLDPLTPPLLTGLAADLVSWMRLRGCGVSYGQELRVLWIQSNAREGLFTPSEGPWTYEEFPRLKRFADLGAALVGVAQDPEHVTVALKLSPVRV